MRRRAAQWSKLIVCGVFALTACGGGGGGGDGGPPSNAPQTFYVRASGDDSDTGMSPGSAFRSVAYAVSQAAAGDMIVVGPGTYVGIVDIPRQRGGTDDDHRLVLVADASGAITGDSNGDVIVQPAPADPAAIRLTGAQFVTIDGFSVTGASGNDRFGIVARSGANNLVIQHCLVHDNEDGILVQDSADLVLFNNLVYDNNNRGIRIAGRGSGSQQARIVNNTVVFNRNLGISIGDTMVPSSASLRNNIFQQNRNRNIDVSCPAEGSCPSLESERFSTDYNLIFPTNNRPFIPRGPNDINEDALFVSVSRDDYRLDQEGSPAIDAADPVTDDAFGDELLKRTTAEDEAADQLPLDLGYHYPR